MGDLLVPTYGTGFARYAADSAFPELWRGLIGCYAPSLGPTGSTLYDWSGNKTDASFNNMEVGDWEHDGERGYVITPDGTDEYVKADIDGTALATVSIAMWLRYATNDTTGYAQWAAALTSGSPWILWRGTGANERLDVYVFGGYNLNTANGDFVAGTWYHVVVTYQSGWTLYINGEVTDTYGGGLGSNQPNAQALYWGNGYGGYKDIDFGDTFVYNRCLTHQEILQIYNGASPLILEDPVDGIVAAAGVSIPVFIHHYKQAGGL